VQATVVKPGDPFDGGQLELASGLPDAVGDQFGLEAVDEALGHGVVIGIADRPDRSEHAVIVEDLGEGVAVYWLPVSL
jgi:hypothetical protein